MFRVKGTREQISPERLQGEDAFEALVFVLGRVVASKPEDRSSRLRSVEASDPRSIA